MVEKCNKYESLFIFGSEEDLQTHLKTCSDCKQEHEKMQNVSQLVKEIAPFVGKKSSSKLLIKVAAGFVVLSLSFLTIYLNQMNTKELYKSEQASVKEKSSVSYKDNSVIAQMGLPTDEYGLLVVE